MKKKLEQGADCTDLFRSAYENRYTWSKEFTGYRGLCRLLSENNIYNGSFVLDKDMKAKVNGIKEESVSKIIGSQLWEVAIHRVRRTFEEVHSQNTFTIGDINDVGIEVIVGGKNKGDRYRIKDNIVTMVYRHIHGSLVNIYTQSVIETKDGYLSKLYTSQYKDALTGKNRRGKSYYMDDFQPLYEGGPWVLSKRVIRSEKFQETQETEQTFIFTELNKLS